MKTWLILLMLPAILRAEIAKDDERDHPTLHRVCEVMTNITTMHDKAMQLFADAIGAKCREGYKVAVVQFLEQPHSVVVCPEIPQDAPLILIKGQNFVVGIYQEDQKKDLGHIADALVPEAIAANAIQSSITATIEHLLDTYYEPDPQ